MRQKAGRRRVSTAPFLTAGFVLLALTVALPVFLVGRERDAARSAQTALLTDARLADLFSTMREGENGLRGYLITGSPISLNTYGQALTNAPRDLAALASVLDTGDDAMRMARVRALAEQKIAQLQATKAMLDAGDKAGAAARIKHDLELRTMVDLRTLVAELRAEEARRLNAARARAHFFSALVLAVIIAAVLATVLLAWAVTAILRGAERALVAANEALERKVEERTATLNASETRFRLLSESMPGLMYMTDANGQTIYVNPQSRAYTGLAGDEALGHGWTKAVHEDDRALCLTEWQRCIASGQNYELEFRLRRHDGLYRWFLDRAVALRDADGSIAGWIGTSTDIHDRKLAETRIVDENAALEQQVAEHAAQLTRFFDLSTDILIIAGFDRRFRFLSPSWERITGWTVSETTKRYVKDFVHPDDVARTEAEHLKVRRGEAISMVNRYRRADGTWCWLSWRTVGAPDEQLVYAVARDITAEREQEEKLRQSQKMEVVGQLTGGVAHDFNNLLTIIMGSQELLRRAMLEGDPKLLRWLDAAHEAANRAASLTHRLLAFSRRQPLEPRPLDVNRLLAGMSDMLHRTLGETVNVELVSAAGLWQALADANQLENAVLNLAVNARDAMPNGGRLSIETQNAYLDETYAAAHADLAAGQYVLIAVSDTGAGMDAETKSKIFEPFFTTKPHGQGTGLGLAQVYGFIKQSGGHIGVYSEPNEGTTIKLYLPRVRGAASFADAAARLPPPAARTTKGRTILVVEDELGVRHFSAEVLAEFGYDVLTAASAREALDLLEQPGPIDMLFTDVVLGGSMNGRQLADAAMQIRPNLVVLFTTGYTPNAIIHHGRLDDGINFIGKPFTASALGEKVAKCFELAQAMPG